jgi:hypothetical protein
MTMQDAVKQAWQRLGVDATEEEVAEVAAP